MPIFHRTTNPLVAHFRILTASRIQMIAIHEQDEWTAVAEMYGYLSEIETDAPAECYATVPSILRMLRAEFSATDRNHEIWRNDRPEAAGQNC